jgi:hypothetical protein
MMSRSGKQNYSALLLEGHDDERLFANYIHSACLPFAMDGRDQVLGTLKVLAFRKQKGVAGVIDADCDYLNGTTHPPNVFRTDLRDLECMLVDSSALQKLLNEHLIPVAVDVGVLKQGLLRCCKDLGYLRWINLTNGWSLDFKGLNFKSFVEPAGLTADRDTVMREAIRQNPGFQVTAEDLAKLIKDVEHTSHRGFHVCAGHDLASVLSLWIEHKKGYPVSKYKVQQQLRLAIESQHFTQSHLIAEMRHWETTNVPFRLLR